MNVSHANELLTLYSMLTGIGCIMFAFVTLVGIGFTFDNYLNPNWLMSREKAKKELGKLICMEMGFIVSGVLLLWMW